MAIEIRPHLGMRREVEIDTGLDGIWVIDPVTPQGRRVGFAQRRKGGAAQLTAQVSEATMRQISKALDDRDFGELDEVKQAMARGQRSIQPPITIEGSETGEDENE